MLHIMTAFHRAMVNYKDTTKHLSIKISRRCNSDNKVSCQSFANDNPTEDSRNLAPPAIIAGVLLPLELVHLIELAGSGDKVHVVQGDPSGLFSKLPTEVACEEDG